jgi:hypothetical protein
MQIVKNKYLYFYKNKDLLGKFICLYISNFLFYAYLFLAGCIIMGVLGYILFLELNGVFKYLQFLWFIPIGYCFTRFIVILSTIQYKWRFYRISHYRLKNKGYSEDYFKYEIYEPCTRLIVKNVLYEYGLKNEYIVLKSKYLKVNQRIEDEKVRILAQVIRRNKLNQT